MVFKLFREVCYLISSKRILYNLGPKTKTLVLPWHMVQNEVILKTLHYLILWWLSVSWAEISETISRERSFLVLKNSVAKARMFLWDLEIELSLLSNSS